jgi:hypothetical protein
MVHSRRSLIVIAAISASGLWLTPEVHGQANHRRGQKSALGQRPPSPLAPRDLIQRVSKSLVSIITQDKEGGPIAQASGFFFREGLVVTNLHVFKRASQGYIKLLNSGLTYKIDTIVGLNRKHDLCVLKITEASAPPLALDTKSNITVGDDIYVGGSPKGLEGTFTKGIVSGVRRDAGLIQIDAAISPGSSGGPVVNNRAVVIGIVVSSLVDGQNLNFAIPAAHLEATALNWNTQVKIAGAFSLTDRDEDKLKGPVHSVVTRHADFEYDPRTDRYTEAEPQLDRKDVYDRDGNHLETEYYYKDFPLQRGEFEYDEEGFVTRIISISRSGKRSERTLTRIESLNQKLNTRHFSETSRIEFTDSNGNRATAYSQIYDRDGNEIETLTPFKEERVVRRFDRGGNEIEVSTYTKGNQGDIDRYTYEFDQYGNWTKQVGSVYFAKFPQLGFAPGRTQYREITYYGR